MRFFFFSFFTGERGEEGGERWHVRRVFRVSSTWGCVKGLETMVVPWCSRYYNIILVFRRRSLEPTSSTGTPFSSNKIPTLVALDALLTASLQKGEVGGLGSERGSQERFTLDKNVEADVGRGEKVRKFEVL